MKRPFKKNVAKRFSKYNQYVWNSCVYSSRYGDVTHSFEQVFAELMGVNFAVAVNSGTSALHVALLASGIGRGDEVIVPALGPTMTAQAVVLAGATPVFADIEMEKQERQRRVPQLTTVFSTENTFKMEAVGVGNNKGGHAVIPVHLFGTDAFIKSSLPTIEDCCQMIDPDLGLRGDIACYSFEQSKQICCGDGGMAITNDPKLAKKMRQFSDGGVSCVTASDGRWKGKAEFEQTGYNYRMPELTAALGLAQIDDFPDRMWEVQHRPMDAAHFEKKLIDFGVEFKRGPWDKLVYEWPIFGSQKGLCPVAERIHPDLFVWPVSEMKKVEKVESYIA